jgi:hypothetical protein
MDGSIREINMSWFAKFVLLILAAFFLVGSSITAAGPKPDKVYTFTSAPLLGEGVYCVAANTTDAAIAIHMDIYKGDGSKLIDNYSWTLDAKNIRGNGGHIGGTAAFCVLSWEGQKGDLKAIFCSQQSSGPDVCIEMD